MGNDPQDRSDQPAGHSPFTAPATLNLATTSALATGLRLLGWEWLPPAQLEPDLSGLYAWLIGRGNEHLPLIQRPVAYLGIGSGKGGASIRVGNEGSWIHEDPYHLHGRSMHQLGGSVIGGPVQRVPDPDVS